MLAEPKKKIKFSVDPQNLKWRNSDKNFGKKLMEKMGWEEGKGLGVDEHGIKDNLKIKANYTQTGFKAKSEQINYDETWLSHHDEFSTLLGNLKATRAKIADESDDSSEDEEKSEIKTKEQKNEKKTIEEKMRSSNKRFFYKKVLMKDLSRYSEKDKTAVIGIRKNKKEEETLPPETFKTENTQVETEKNNVSTSTVSVNDYFANKMSKFYAKKNSQSAENLEKMNKDVTDSEEEKSARKVEKRTKNKDEVLEKEPEKKKKKKRFSDDEDN